MRKGGKNVVLIGMPGSGKSTLGVLLAKVLGLRFVDADLVIQEREGRLLQEIIDADGIDGFLRVEEEVLASLDEEDAVIATGGSAIYSEKAMEALKKHGTAVYLRVPYPEIERRITNISTRGIVLREGKTLRDTYDERIPLYERWADLTVDCDGHEMEDSLAAVVAALGRDE